MSLGFKRLITHKTRNSILQRHTHRIGTVRSTVGPAVGFPSLSQPGGCLLSPTSIKEMTVNDSLPRVKWVVLFRVRVEWLWLDGFTAHSTTVFLRVSFDNRTRARYYYYYYSYCYSVLYHRCDVTM